MITLFLIWLSSLLAMLILSLCALLRLRGASANFVSRIPSRSPELPAFIRLQIEELFRHLHVVAKRSEPHARRLSVVVISLGKRGHDYFIERIFGRIIRERGKASSFFLKHIAEHKEALNKDSDLVKK